MSDFPYGSLIQNVTVSGVNIDVFSNGSSSFLSSEVSVDKKGAYLGLKYQCVEFVRRFIYAKHQINLANKWRAKDASDWYDNREVMGLETVDLSQSSPGDILTFAGGACGHVSIIKYLQIDGVTFCGQNFFNDTRDAGFFLPFASVYNQEGILGDESKEYKFQSVLRVART